MALGHAFLIGGDDPSEHGRSIGSDQPFAKRRCGFVQFQLQEG